MALAQTSYPDATGEITVGSFPHLDITSVEVAADTGTNQLIFTIFVEGDPTNPDWGRYIIALKSASAGTTGRLTGPGVTGETTGRPITFPSGMTHWIGTWNSGGAIWTYDSGWTRSGTVAPVKDGAGKNITITVPFSALALSAGETFTFDVISSGGGGSDSAVDALSLSTSSISAWSEAFASAEPVSFTMPSAADSDGDGLPDAWEIAHFTNLSKGPADDPDGDVLDNAGEFSRSTNPTQPDTDADGLSDKVEDNNGVYAGPSAPGTNPILGDSDNDGHLDGAEANGTTALLYETNPLRKNFAVFTVPGDFNNWDPAGLATPSNAMTAVGTSLTDQFQWRLDYHFIGSGQAILYKYAGGSWSDNWGTGAGIGVPSGDNIADTIIASGIHRFTFDQVTFAYTFTRPTFDDLTAYLAAYHLETEPLADGDGDGLTNSAEFAGNSDPTNLDTDGDTLADGLDSDPLQPATAYDIWIATTSVPVRRPRPLRRSGRRWALEPSGIPLWRQPGVGRTGSYRFSPYRNKQHLAVDRSGRPHRSHLRD